MNILSSKQLFAFLLSALLFGISVSVSSQVMVRAERSFDCLSALMSLFVFEACLGEIRVERKRNIFGGSFSCVCFVWSFCVCIFCLVLGDDWTSQNALDCTFRLAVYYYYFFIVFLTAKKVTRFEFPFTCWWIEAILFGLFL